MRDIWVCFFFFQAEDGIRDLVRSRGLGDVYKRQVDGGLTLGGILYGVAVAWTELEANFVKVALLTEAVSYTHLTLPTSDLV